MARVIVIADDFTGAAEIGAIALEHGLSVEILREARKSSDADVIVYDTASRCLDAGEARKCVAEFGAMVPGGVVVFKKIDSVLRGPVRAEVEAMLGAMGLKKALIVAQNPTKGRVIIGGKYLVNGVELEKTEFAADPRHPARSSDVVEILGSGVRYAEPGSAMVDGVTIGGGATTVEIEGWAKAVDGRTLVVGGAEFFAALLKSRGLARREVSGWPTGTGAMLVVCGSKPKGEIPNAMHMPLSLNHWRAEIFNTLALKQCAVMAAPIGECFPEEVTEGLAAAVDFVLAKCDVKWLVIEGGETAAAIVRKMGWMRFLVLGQLGPGVVQLEVFGKRAPRLIVKPGSYPWPNGIRAVLGI